MAQTMLEWEVLKSIENDLCGTQSRSPEKIRYYGFDSIMALFLCRHKVILKAILVQDYVKIIINQDLKKFP